MTKKEIWQYLREVNPTFEEMNLPIQAQYRIEFHYRNDWLEVDAWFEEMDERYGE